MNLPEISIRNPVFAWMLMVSLVLFGAMNYREMGVSLLPDVDFPFVGISASLPGATPEMVEEQLVVPIEEALASVKGIEEMNSNARQGGAWIGLNFALEKDVDQALQEVQASLSGIQRQLPRGVEPPTVMKFNSDDDAILEIAVTAKNKSPSELMNYVKNEVVEPLRMLDGVGGVDISGYAEPIVSITLDPAKMSKLQLTAGDVLQTLSSENTEVPSGEAVVAGKEFSLRTRGEAKSLSELREIAISRRGGGRNYVPVTLADIATIKLDTREVEDTVRLNGENAVTLEVKKQRGSNAVKVAHLCKKRLNELTDSVGEGIRHKILYDPTLYIEESVDELLFTVALSALLTAIVCWIFLGSLSATLNVILAIPTSVIGSFVVLNYLGFTLNNFTLLGLSLAIGIVVDDAIMVLENIVRHYENGKDRATAALVGTQEIMFAALAATAAIVAIFLPVAFMKGIIGKFFYEFGITISVAVALSLLEAITLTPMRCASFIAQSKNRRGLGKWLDEGFDAMAAAYSRTIPALVKYRFWVMGAVTIVFIASLLPIKKMRFEFAPEAESGFFRVSIEYEGDVEKSKLENTTLDIEKQVREILTDVDWTTHDIGERYAGISFKIKNIKELKPFEGKDKPPSQNEILDLLRKRFKDQHGAKIGVTAVPLGGFNIGGLAGGRRGRFQISIVMRGPSYTELEKQGKDLKKLFTDHPGISEVNLDQEDAANELLIIPDRMKAIAYGVSIGDISQLLQSVFEGVDSEKISINAQRIDLVVRFPEYKPNRASEILNLRLRNDRGQDVALRDVASIQESSAPDRIRRENRSRIMRIFANVDAGKDANKIGKELITIAKQQLPSGYVAKLGGAAVQTDKTFYDLGMALILGIVVAYMILASQFNSYVDPWTILVALPFSLSGAVVALYFTGQTINIFSAIGVILLMGLVKKNSILLVDYTNQLRHEKFKNNIISALAEACPTRLRPILMTSIATIVAAIPPAISLGPGAESRMPLAIAVIGGMLISTMLTLFVVPCVYYSFARKIGD